MGYQIIKCRWESGEHYRMLVDRDTGMPAFWPTLYITTQVRNKGKSVAAMEVALGAINVLLGFTETRGIDLEERVLKREFMDESELDDLRGWAQKVHGEGRGAGKGKTRVGAAHVYNRLNQIAKYLEWFAGRILGTRRKPADDNAIEALVKGILSRRCDPLLEGIHAHASRHYWNWLLSDAADKRIAMEKSDCQGLFSPIDLGKFQLTAPGLVMLTTAIDVAQPGASTWSA